MMVNPAALTIRAKKLGVLIRDARISAGKSQAECANFLGVAVETFDDYEYGSKSPSLPELEVLAFRLDVPVEHFWGQRSISTEEGEAELDLQKLIVLRQRIIGVLLRKARLDAGLSLEELAERTWSSAGRLEAYEMGEIPVPVPDLEALSSELDLPLIDFRDQRGPVGDWASRRQMLQDFIDLPAELQAFIAKPINLPYLEIAMRLSEMSVDRLRAVAEGLLEITL